MSTLACRAPTLLRCGLSRRLSRLPARSRALRSATTSASVSFGLELDAAAAHTAVPIHAVRPKDLANKQALVSRIGQDAYAWATTAGYKASAGSVLLLPGAGGALGGVLLGLGELASDEGSFHHGSLPSVLPAGLYALAPGSFQGGNPTLNPKGYLPFHPSHVALGWALGSYKFGRYKSGCASGGDAPAPTLLLPPGADAADVCRVAAGVWLGRDLINTPANDCGPEELEAAVFELAAKHGARVTSLVGEDLLTGPAGAFPLIHAVGRASFRPPRLIDLTWGDERDEMGSLPKVTLVGKGVVFDTGGLDIKPASNMLAMKKDMGGAAACIALAHIIMDAGLRVRLRLLVPAVENSIDGNAFRPSDVITSRKGLTVEIGNTDAEGRLVLADALAWADEEYPEILVDMATLTGAHRVALGTEIPGVFTDDEALAAELAAASSTSYDPTWRLPLWKPYGRMLDSKIADTNSVSEGGYGGAITAALFLQKFVSHTAAKGWLHIDLNGWTALARAGHPAGGEPQGVRALYALLKARYGRR